MFDNMLNLEGKPLISATYDFGEVESSTPAASTIYKRQARPLTAPGCWTGFLFFRIISDLRRFLSFWPFDPITPVSGSPSYPASLSAESSPDLVRFPASFPATADRRSRLPVRAARRQVGKLVDTLHDSVKQVVDVHARSLLAL